MSAMRPLRVFLQCHSGDVEDLIRAEAHQLHACDPEWAIAAAGSLGLDVAIFDMEEGESPFSLANRIRDVSPRYKPMFIGLTGPLSAGNEARCRAAGIDLLLFKPVQKELLAGLLRRLGNVLDDYLSFDPSI